MDQSQSSSPSSAAYPGAGRLLWAGFFAIFAAGVGFSIRGGILLQWGAHYNFTQTELGAITGGGLTGFGVVILLGSLLADKIGYGRLMGLAFVIHIISAGLQLAVQPIYDNFGREHVYWNLYLAMFLFAIANGICEAVVNPMVATLYPRDKTHYLNILHAGWPGGLIVGGLLSYFMNGGAIGEWVPLGRVGWLIQMSFFLVPVAIYGLLCLGQRFPASEATEAGVSYREMFAQFASPILLLLLFIHALVGYVELGTDSWISKITGSIMEDPTRGLLLFVYTSGLMFLLRFFGGPLERMLSPLGLLFLSGILGFAGLSLLGRAETIEMCIIAATIYALGKTFLWPTMLAVVSELYPKGGAIVLGAVGGIGMLSAGLLGAPGIGFKQDFYAAKQLKETTDAPAGIFDRYAAEKESQFLLFKEKGLDGTKVSILEWETKLESGKTKPDDEAEFRRELDRALDSSKPANQKTIDWRNATRGYFADDADPVGKAGLFGGKMALQLTAFVPLLMAGLYLLLIVYFKATGGYKAVDVRH